MTDEEKARKAVLAWIESANSLLGSAVLLEMTNPRGIVTDWQDSVELTNRFWRLATRWDEEFSKTCPLLGIAEADARSVSGGLHGLAVMIDQFPPLNDVFTTVDVEQMRNGCLAAMAKLSRLVAVPRDQGPRNIQRGRPSAK